MNDRSITISDDLDVNLDSLLMTTATTSSDMMHTTTNTTHSSSTSFEKDNILVTTKLLFFRVPGPIHSSTVISGGDIVIADNVTNHEISNLTSTSLTINIENSVHAA